MKHCIAIILALFSQVIFASSVKTYVVLDTSGSMARWLPKIEPMITTMQSELANQVGEPVDISVVGFTHQASILVEGDSSDVKQAIQSIRLQGGVEDAFVPLNRIASLHQGDGAHILLISDEPRTKVITLSQERLIAQLNNKGITVHLIQPRQLECAAQRVISVSASYEGLTPFGNYIDCPDLDSNTSLATDEYAGVAFGVFGKVWTFQSALSRQKLVAQKIASEIAEAHYLPKVATINVEGIAQAGYPLSFILSDIDESITSNPDLYWEWSFGAAHKALETGMAASYIFSKPGLYKVTAYLVDGANEQPRQTVSIMVEIK